MGHREVTDQKAPCRGRSASFASHEGGGVRLCDHQGKRKWMTRTKWECRSWSWRIKHSRPASAHCRWRPAVSKCARRGTRICGIRPRGPSSVGRDVACTFRERRMPARARTGNASSRETILLCPLIGRWSSQEDSTAARTAENVLLVVPCSEQRAVTDPHGASSGDRTMASRIGTSPGSFPWTKHSLCPSAMPF